jgi:hypothetical protein
MTLTVAYPTAPTTDLRDWLRDSDRTALYALVVARTFAGGLPKNTTLPAVAIKAIGGFMDNAGLWVGQVQCDCFAATGPAAEALALTLCSALASATGREVLTSGDTLTGATPEAPIWVPDDNDNPRYVVTAQVTIRPS